MPLSNAIKEHLQKELGRAITTIQVIGGGCINESYKLTTEKAAFFCKINSATKFPHVFDREATALTFLAQQPVLKVPQVKAQFTAGDQQILVLEWIHTGERTEAFWKKFGASLAALHSVSHSYFGFTEDNYMGSVPQSNKPTDHWPDFFIEQRLKPLMEQCRNKQLLTTAHQQQFEKLYPRLPQFFEPEPPALLHGDLWSGNFMCSDQSEPVLIDPAVYFGHRSVDLGMTQLFGGFRSAFYEAYQYHYPFPNNYEAQWQLCNLYPLLIHLLLFGRSYLSQIENILSRFA